MIEGSGSIPLTNGSGSGPMRPKNMWIRWIWIRIRILNTGSNTAFSDSVDLRDSRCGNCQVSFRKIPLCFRIISSAFEGTVSREFLLLVSWVSFPQAQSIPLVLFLIFFKNLRRKSRCTTSINDTCGKIAASINDIVGKFATSINDTGGKKFCHQFSLCCWYRWQICKSANFPPVSTIPAAIFPPV